ncbi:hypothetical protein KL918_002726 [Ogataea parapolymorpha]|nr:hypothetical protein KL918_002726 [Ogataea parapolymorpha]KAG7871013.1 hypothetical protein KL916_004379 [Ogataea parapolymorpha]
MSETERDNDTNIDLAMSQNTQNLGDVDSVIQKGADQDTVLADSPVSDPASNEIDKQDSKQDLSRPAGIEADDLLESEPPHTEGEIEHCETVSDQPTLANSAETPLEKTISDNNQTEGSAVLGPENGTTSEEIPADSSEPLQDAHAVSLEPESLPQDSLLVDSIPSNDVVQHIEQPDVSKSPLDVEDTPVEDKDETEHVIETVSVDSGEKSPLPAEQSETVNKPNTETAELPVEPQKEVEAIQETPEKPEQIEVPDVSAANIPDTIEDPVQEPLSNEADKHGPADSIDPATTVPAETSQPEEATLPWDEEPVESLPWETDGPSGFLPKEQPLEQSQETAPEQPLAQSTEKAPEGSLGQPQKEILPWDTEPSEPLPWEERKEQDPLPWEATPGTGSGNEVNVTQSFLDSLGVESASEAPKNDPSVEDSDVLSEVQKEKSQEVTEQDVTATVKPAEPEEAAKPQEEQQTEPKLDDKLSFLEEDNELLLDEVLDDDFLDDEPSAAQATIPVSQTPAVGLSRQSPAPAFASRYAPQGFQTTSPPPAILTPSYTNFQAPSFQQSHIKEKLEKEKKKTDAYDFPAELLAKHAPISKTPAPKQNVYTMIELQKSHAHNPASPASQSNPLPPRAGSVSSTRSTPPPGRATLKPQKSFFEELPLPSIATPSLHPKNPYELNASSSTAKNPYQPKSPAISRASPYSPIVANAQLAGVNQPPAGAVHPPPPVGGRPRKSTNPYAPAEAGGHARTPSTTSTPPVNPNVVPVPHKSPIAKIASPRSPNAHMQFAQSASDTNNFGIPQLQLGASQPQVRHHSNPQKATKYSPYAPQAQQSKLVPFPHPSAQPKSNFQPLDSVYGDNLKPDTSSPTVSHNRRSSFLPPGKNSGYSSTRSNASTHLVQSTPAPVVVNPENLVRRQWPLFSFSGSNKVAYLIPSSYGYGHHKHNVEIIDGNCVFKNELLVQQFPGPLVKNRTKRKDVEKWINDKLLSLGADLEGPFTSEVHLLWAVMRALVININKPGDFAQKEYLRSVVQVLNPSLVVSDSQDGPTDLSSIETYFVPNQKPFNAHKLEQVGLLNLSKYLEVGDKLSALQMAIGEEDWAIALIVANLLGPEAFAKVTKLYTERTFDAADVLQQNLSFCLQSSGENGLSAEQFHGKEEWVIDNFRSVIPFVLLNNKNPAPVLVQVGTLLSEAGFELHGKLCFLLSGLPLIPKIQTVSPSDIDSMIIDELYEYVLSSSSNIPPAFSNGFPHILSVKVRHASYLLDVGHFAEAKKYVDHTTGVIKSKATYVDPTVAFANDQLLERLSQTEIEVSGWFGGKLGRSGLDKVWGHLDKSFNKFVAGEELEDGKKAKSEGVFAKYSPAPSRTQSQLDLSTIQPQSQPVIPTYQTLSRAPSFGMYASSSHSQSAPTTSSTSTLIQSHQPYSQAKTKSKKASAYAPLSQQGAGNVYDNEKPMPNTAPLSSPGSSPSAQIADQTQGAVSYPPAAARSQSFVEVGRARPELPFTTSTPGPGQTYAPQSPFQLDNREASGKVSKYGPRKEPADFSAYSPAPAGKEEKPDFGEEHDTSIMTDDIVQQPAARKFVPNRVESLEISPVQSNEPPALPAAPPTLPESQAENKPPKASNAPPKKPNVYNPYAHVTSRKSNGSKQSRYKPATNVMAESTQAPNDTNAQDSQAPDFDSYDFYSYGGYHAPTAAEIEAAKKAEVEEKERQEEESLHPAEKEPEDHRSPELESDIDSEPNDEPLPPPSGRILRPAASFHAADASHLQSMFDPPSAPYRPAKSPATVITDQKRYHAEDDDQEYYDDVVDDDDDDDEETKEQKRKHNEEEEKKKKEQEEAKMKEEQQKHAERGGSSWFGWLGKKKNDQPKPIRAKLGEESSFYYDEKLKRWVNKNASPEEQAASTPPPPPPVKRAVSDSASVKPQANKPGAMGAPPRGPPAGPPTPATVNGAKKSDNIEDLLSMSASTARKSKRGPRRGYVDVMGQK